MINYTVIILTMIGWALIITFAGVIDKAVQNRKTRKKELAFLRKQYQKTLEENTALKSKLSIYELEN